MGRHKPQLGEELAINILSHWTQTAELDVAAGRFNEALSLLAEAQDSFMLGAYPREFCRVARLTLSSLNWVADHHRFTHFEDVFWAHIRNLSYLGSSAEVDDLLGSYAKTLGGKDSRYIGFCEMKCYEAWVLGDYATALEWGRSGRQLKDVSGVDTHYALVQTLALVERDAGNPEAALPMFLSGHAIEEIIDANRFVTNISGQLYGNIGRCLQFMGQVESALVCYQKSALLLERKPTQEHVINQGFIRAWLGELLAVREEFQLAAIFLRAAHLKWEAVAPPRAERIALMLEQIKRRLKDPGDMSNLDVEKICLNWIMGSPLAAKAS